MNAANGPPFADAVQARRLLGLVTVCWGVQAIVSQSLLVREALVLMYGSEFAWSVVLFAWLLGVGVGAAVGGLLADRLRRPALGLALVLLALGAATVADLWAFRGARAWLGIEPGELMPLPVTAAAAVLLVSPASLFVGMAFPLACVLAERRRIAGARQAAGPLAHVYAYESIGSLIGGAAFSFWAVEHLAPIQTALLCGAMTAAGLAVLLRWTAPAGQAAHPDRAALPGSAELPSRAAPPDRTVFPGMTRRRRWTAWAIACVAATAAIVACAGGRSLDRRLVERRWRTIAPGYELRAEAESRYQNLAVGRRDEQYSLYCDGQAAADFPDPYTFVPLAHFWMCQHPQPRTVLMLGGGAEGLLAEILCHSVRAVDYLEPDARQIEMVRPFLSDADRAALMDSRVSMHHQDARHFLKTQQDRYDLVIARLPEPTSALRARFYTTEFYAELRRAMTRRAVLCTMAAAAPGELSAISSRYLASIRRTIRTSFPEVVVSWSDPAHVLAATEPGLLTIDPGELRRRYERRGVRTERFDPLWFEGATDWLEPEKIRRRAAELDAVQPIEISTDLRPIVYVQRLILWEAAMSRLGSSEPGFIAWLRGVRLATVGCAIAVFCLVILIACRWRSGFRESKPSEVAAERRSGGADGALVVSIGTTGLVTMALSIVWLFAFQSLYGYVYQRIGWIIALFMAGLVVGCGWIGWRSNRRAARCASLGSPQRASPGLPDSAGSRRPSATRLAVSRSAMVPYLWHRLVCVDVLLALLSGIVPLVLPALQRLPASPAALAAVEWTVSLLVLLTGVLGGAAFAAAGGLRQAWIARAGSAAAGVVGADHIGACVGAALTGILLVPVFGIATTALLLAAIKLGSAGLLAVTRPRAGAA